MKEEDNQCSKSVYDSTSWSSYPCSKKSKVEREGKKYCTIHDPEYVKGKENKADEKYNSECCKGCKYHFPYPHYKFCPLCGKARFPH